MITVTVATKAAATRKFTYSTTASLRWEPECKNGLRAAVAAEGGIAMILV